jgi:hypothetical protein
MGQGGGKRRVRFPFLVCLTGLRAGTDHSRHMGFNRRKLEDQRQQVAEKQAAARRATEAQVLEDAERLIAAWNERQAKRMPMIFSPTIGAAITARFWFLWVRCPACRTIKAIDLRTLDRHRDAAVTSLIPALSCRSCRPNAPFPSSFGYRKRASPTKCARSIGGECSGTSAGSARWPRANAPTESKGTARERYERELATNPRFQEAPNTGQIICIVGARPTSAVKK